MNAKPVLMAMLLTVGGAALAQGAGVAAALDAGQVGEQADGYLGVRGSVSAANAAELMSQPDVDGALVGGASLEPGSFAAIVAAAG